MNASKFALDIALAYVLKSSSRRTRRRRGGGREDGGGAGGMLFETTRYKRRPKRRFTTSSSSFSSSSRVLSLSLSRALKMCRRAEREFSKKNINETLNNRGRKKIKLGKKKSKWIPFYSILYSPPLCSLFCTRDVGVLSRRGEERKSLESR